MFSTRISLVSWHRFLQCTANAAADQCLLHNTKHAYDERLLASMPGTLLLPLSADIWRYHRAGNSSKTPCSLLPPGPNPSRQAAILERHAATTYRPLYLSLVATIRQPSSRGFSPLLADQAVHGLENGLLAHRRRHTTVSSIRECNAVFRSFIVRRRLRLHPTPSFEGHWGQRRTLHIVFDLVSTYLVVIVVLVNIHSHFLDAAS